MHKSATKCNETIGKWCKNKHGASKIIDTFETYQAAKNLKLKNEAVHLNAVILNLKTERKMSRKLQLAENRARDRKQILFMIFLVGCCSLYALTALL
jgi:hypothetical protein